MNDEYLYGILRGVESDLAQGVRFTAFPTEDLLKLVYLALHKQEKGS